MKKIVTYCPEFLIHILFRLYFIFGFILELLGVILRLINKITFKFFFILFFIFEVGLIGYYIYFGIPIKPFWYLWFPIMYFVGILLLKLFIWLFNKLEKHICKHIRSFYIPGFLSYIVVNRRAHKGLSIAEIKALYAFPKKSPDMYDFYRKKGYLL